MITYLCSGKIYEYDGWLFERGYIVWPLKKDGELKKKAGKKFYDMIAKFEKLPEIEKRKYRISGGCTKHYLMGET